MSIHGLERSALQLGRAAASRGLIVRSWRARFGGQPAPPPHASFFCTEWGRGNHRTVVELAPPPNVTKLLPGDFIEADLELVVFPTDPAAYYGPNKSFQKLLTRDADTWRLVQREASGNALKLEARSGMVVNSYPIAVAVDPHQRAEISWQGGLGCLPITFTGLTKPRGYQLALDGHRVDQSIHGNDFWQTDYDSKTKRWRMTFNVRLEAGPSATHTLRFGQEDLNQSGHP